jgi:protein disulfide-isomerase-like protein
MQNESGPVFKDHGEILRMLLAYSLPTVIRFNSDLQPIIQSLPIKRHVLFFCDLEGDADFIAAVDAVASSTANKGKLLFIEVPSTEYQVINFFGLTRADLPQFIIADLVGADEGDLKRYHFYDYLWLQNQNLSRKPKSTHVTGAEENDYNKKIYRLTQPGRAALTASTASKPDSADKAEAASAPLEDDSGAFMFSMADLDAFLADFQAALLPRSILSETPEDVAALNAGPADPDIEHIIAHTFPEKVQRPEQDVLVFFYAAWCGHCKSIEPIVAHTAKFYAADASFKLYKIDGSKNEVSHPKVRVRGFPTIYLFPRHDKANPVEFDGERTIEALLDFVGTYRSTGSELREMEVRPTPRTI